MKQRCKRQGNKELGRQTERDRLREGEREKGCRDKMLENGKERMSQ